MINHSYYYKLLPDGRYEAGIVQYNLDDRRKDVCVPIVSGLTYSEAEEYLIEKLLTHNSGYR